MNRPPASSREAPSSSESVSLVTVSYRGDVELAAELCRSVDKFLDESAEHVLVVPRSDVSLFEPLLSPRRRIVVVEDVLPRGYKKLPFPRQIRIGTLFEKRLREMWVSPVGIARGWIIQQIVKLSAPSYVSNEIVVFADSDIVLIAPLTSKSLVSKGQTRLYRVPGATSDSAMHIAWHKVSSRLLAIPETGYLGADYIGNLITWRRSTITLLQERLSRVSGKRWDKVVATQTAFSEYILYGVFAEHVLSLNTSHHFGTDEDLVLAGWFFDLSSPQGLADFTSSWMPSHVAVAIQSTEPFTLSERRDIVRSIDVSGDR